jgi:hypothetical protein
MSNSVREPHGYYSRNPNARIFGLEGADAATDRHMRVATNLIEIKVGGGG